MTLTSKDICMIIPTYNRAEDIGITLKSIMDNRNLPGKIFIADQSKDKETKKIVKKYAKKIPIEYVSCKIPSTNISVNKGLKKYRYKYPLILIAADDVDFLEGYLKEMLKEFNSNPKIMMVGGAEIESKKNGLKIGVSDIILSLFFLPHKTPNKFKIIGPYGNTSSPKIDKIIRNVQWIPGFNTCARSEVYKNYLWPETRGYDVISDIDSSYRVYKKCGKGSLVITPRCKVHHRYSHIARYDEKKRIFVNHEDHFSFYYMHFNNIIGKLKMILSLIGILLGNLLRIVFRLRKENFNALRYNMQAILYCYKNRINIKNKKYREFLDDGLYIKKDL